MKFKFKPSNRLWFNIFLKVGVIFAAFVVVLTAANSTLLTTFFCYKEKHELVRQIKRIEQLDINDDSAVLETLGDISDNKNFEVEIYDASGVVMYTTRGSQLMDFLAIGNNGFSMAHENTVPDKQEKLSDGIVYEEVTRRFDGGSYMLCRKKLDGSIYAEVRIRRQLVTASADIASEFVTLIAFGCFAISVIWILVFARRFSKPLSKMNEITRDMANLKFDRKLDINRGDEIGQLAVSINDMSDSLSAALGELKESNEKLRDEIELERSLDKMRREFVADVSHELKTPISIISGYAEGLKLNINAESREKYCDTIISESARMNRLVLSILELSKYESGQVPIKPEVFDISEVAREMAERIVGNKAELVFEIPDNTLVFADELQTEQVLKAYLENAVSHTAGKGKITVSSADAGEKKRISIHNTGDNISEEIMPHIWQSFYRGDASHKRDENRFGLGLSIVYAIMRMHGCDCGVYNTGDGVCFWFESKKAAPLDKNGAL